MITTLQYKAQLLLVGMAGVLENNGDTELAKEILKNIYPEELKNLSYEQAVSFFDKLITDNIENNMSTKRVAKLEIENLLKRHIGIWDTLPSDLMPQVCKIIDAIEPIDVPGEEEPDGNIPGVIGNILDKRASRPMTSMERLDEYTKETGNLRNGPDRERVHDRLLIQALLEAVAECWDEWRAPDNLEPLSRVLRSWGK